MDLWYPRSSLVYNTKRSMYISYHDTKLLTFIKMAAKVIPHIIDINPLKANGNYMYRALSSEYFCI
jgi:hypothetical protein